MQRMSYWRSSLRRRMFLIESIRPMPKKSNPETLPITSGKCPRINSPKTSFRSSSTENQERVSAGNQSNWNERELETATSRQALIALRHFVPKMPNTIVKLMHYWRFECPSSLGFPVKKFGDPPFRSENISNYTDAIRRKGQRQIFARHKKLVGLVRYSVKPPIRDSRDRIQNFNSEWNDMVLNKVLLFSAVSLNSVRESHETNERFIILSTDDIVRFD